jgi:hypothetical protein
MGTRQKEAMLCVFDIAHDKDLKYARGPARGRINFLRQYLAPIFFFNFKLFTMCDSRTHDKPWPLGHRQLGRGYGPNMPSYREELFALCFYLFFVVSLPLP